MSIASRLEKAYDIQNVDVDDRGNSIVIRFMRSEKVKEITMEYPIEVALYGLETYYFWFYKEFDIEIQPYLI